MDYGKAIRICRAAFGLRQAELARRLDIGQSHLSLIESGKRRPSLSVVEQIAAELRIPLHLLTLLASEPEDLVGHDEQEVQKLARSLLRLLVEATPDSQSRLPLMKKED